VFLLDVQRGDGSRLWEAAWTLVLCRRARLPGLGLLALAFPGPRAAPRSAAGRVVRTVGCAAGPGQALALALALAGPAGAASAMSATSAIGAWSSSEGSCAG
jgi:hypothetical protein